MEDLFAKFTISILKLNKIVQKIKTYEMKKFGLSSVHVMCLYALNYRREGLTSSELVKTTLEDKAAISRAVAAMRKLGYVQVIGPAHNARVTLTQEGVKFAEYIFGRTEAAVAAGRADFTEQEREFFYNSLIKISDNLINYYNGLSGKAADPGQTEYHDKNFS